MKEAEFEKLNEKFHEAYNLLWASCFEYIERVITKYGDLDFTKQDTHISIKCNNDNNSYPYSTVYGVWMDKDKVFHLIITGNTDYSLCNRPIDITDLYDLCRYIREVYLPKEKYKNKQFWEEE